MIPQLNFEFGKVLKNLKYFPVFYKVFDKVAGYEDFLKHVAISQIELHTQE